MGFISSVFKKIISTSQFLIETILGRRRDWEGKIETLDESEGTNKEEQTQQATGDSSSVYSPEAPDIKLREQCRQYIINKFPYGVTHYINNSTVDQRASDVKNMTFEMAEVYGVKINDVILYVPETDLEKSAWGYFSPNDNSVYLNASLVYCNDNILNRQVYVTILHELKHARQWAAVNKWQDYGYSKDLIYSWNYNWNAYIRPEESDEGYRKQPLEFDAFEFSNEIKYLFFL